MSIACQCIELVAGPTVGYQVGGQGDGSGYIRQHHHQQQQQQQPQQGAMIRGLSCISIYVKSNNTVEEKPCWKDSDVPAPVGDHEEVFRSVGKDRLVDLQSPSIVLASKDSGCINLGAECNMGNVDDNYRGVCGDSFRSEDWCIPKDSVSESSSSIGQDDSLSSSVDDDAGDMEVESKLKGPLDSLAELEDSLPIKRGLSNFFSGKSKSFTCLADAVSVKDLVKSDNPYNKRRRNLLPYSSSWERNRFHAPRNSSAGISKKAMHSSKSTLALAVVMSKSEDSLERDEKESHLPPLPPQGKWQMSFASPRSFSLTDLQGV